MPSAAKVRELFAEWLRAHSPGKLLCLDDRAQVRGGGGTAWAWTKPRAFAVRSVPAAGAPG